MPSWSEMLVQSAFTSNVTRIESFDVSLTFSSLFMKSLASLHRMVELLCGVGGSDQQICGVCALGVM